MFFFYRPLNAACKHLCGFISGFVHAVDGILIQWIQCFVRLENTDIGCLVRVDYKKQERGFNVKKNLHSYLA